MGFSPFGDGMSIMFTIVPVIIGIGFVVVTIITVTVCTCTNITEPL